MTDLTFRWSKIRGRRGFCHNFLSVLIHEDHQLNTLSNSLSFYLPSQIGWLPVQLPSAWQVLVRSPTSLYWGSHSNSTVLRKVKTSPYLTPLSGVPGSPQLTTENNRITLSLVFGVVNFNYSLKVTIQLVEFEFHIRFNCRW